MYKEKMNKKSNKNIWGYFYRAAGGRFTEAPAAEMVARRDETIPLKGIHLFDKAHAVMLIEEDIIPRNDGARILDALSNIDVHYEKTRQETGGGGHSGESYLIDKLGQEIGGQLHVGRSSADLIAVAVRVEQRDYILEIMSSLIELNQTLLEVARQHTETILPAYTHFHQAQQITFAHYLVSWIFEYERDYDRLMETYKRTNVSPAGAAIVSGSPFSINRERVAELLGFDSVIQNTRDAIFGFDHHLELFSVLAILTNGLARFCSDLYIWSSLEFDMVELKDRFCGTSSINPHKKNPQALEQIFSLAAFATGNMNTAFAVDRMPSESWEIQWRVWSQELWPLLTQTLQALTLLKNVVETLEIKEMRMLELTQTGWSTAADLAAALVKEKSLPWRSAHNIIGKLVQNCVEQEISPPAVTTNLVDEAARQVIGKKVGLKKSSIKAALDPVQCVNARQLTGGPAPNQVARQIKLCSDKVERGKKEIIHLKKALVTSGKMLDKAIDSFRKVT
jgi:argininosuccinate lyase